MSELFKRRLQIRPEDETDFFCTSWKICIAKDEWSTLLSMAKYGVEHAIKEVAPELTEEQIKAVVDLVNNAIAMTQAATMVFEL